MKIFFEDLGTVDYQKAWDYQEQLFNETIALKLQNRNTSGKTKPANHHLLFCQHPHVYTLGKSGTQSNLLISETLLKKIGAQFYRINRGGDITYHGPGQIVGYPIFDLETMNLGIKDYICLLENAIIETLSDLNIPAARLTGATGVWIDVGSTSHTRKICAIGVRASRHVTMHGFALNVNTNLDYFRHINPCGFIDKGVTSIENELGAKQNENTIKEILLKQISKAFRTEIYSNPK